MSIDAGYSLVWDNVGKRMVRHFQTNEKGNVYNNFAMTLMVKLAFIYGKVCMILGDTRRVSMLEISHQFVRLEMV